MMLGSVSGPVPDEREGGSARARSLAEPMSAKSVRRTDALRRGARGRAERIGRETARARAKRVVASARARARVRARARAARGAYWRSSVTRLLQAFASAMMLGSVSFDVWPDPRYHGTREQAT